VAPRETTSTRRPKDAQRRGAKSGPRVRDREVLDTAAEVFARQGYAAASIQEIAERLGILKGSIYYYIVGKEDLLLRLLNEVHEELDEVLQAVAARSDEPALQRLEHYVRAQAEYTVGNLTKVSVYYDNFDQLSPQNRKAIRARRKVHEEFVVDLVLDGQREGSIDDSRDARLIAYSIFSTVIWPYRWFRPRGRVKAADVVDACVAFVMRGIAPAGS
jgi:AcrR family transcriptional regulator